MTTTVSNGITTLTPTVVLGWESRQPSKTQIHPILGSTNPDVTTRPALLRTGTLELMFATEANANSCRTMHTAAGVFTLTSNDLSYISMSYVVAGEVTVKLDDVTLNRFVVSIDFQEVVT